MTATFVARAHGRVNLIGEHTDYNGGWVLPTTINPFTEIRLIKCAGDGVTLHSDGHRTFCYRLGDERPAHEWSDYLMGATKFLREAGVKLTGLEAWVSSTIPEGAGLSSSAALEISFLKALRKAFVIPVDDVDLALLGQRIENEFVGARVGIMDQMAVSLTQPQSALFLDTRELRYERVPLPYDLMDLLIINSGVTHKLSAKGGYNQRRSECEEACAQLGILQLRDISLTELERKSLPFYLRKRARHVVSENERVFKAVDALWRRDVSFLGELFYDSHRSMRDDYEVSIPEIDFLVELCQREPEIFGARLTGGGFGGSVVVLTRKGRGADLGERIKRSYETSTHQRATLLI